MASTVMPEDPRDILLWCEFIFSKMGIYREAMRRIVSYFITDLEVTSDDASRDEKDKFKDFLAGTIDYKSVLNYVSTDYACFHGDTPVVTRDGVYPIRELAGRTVDVLSQGGSYRPAVFRSFGRQPLMEVTFSDERKILATPEHEWVARNCSDKLVRVPTSKLRHGYRIERTVAPRPEKNDDYYEGVRHGFTFCDGTVYNKHRENQFARANFYGAKDRAMLRYFEGHGSSPIPVQGRDAMQIHGLPPSYKRLPPTEASPSYWYGFVCGFLAADGSVDTYGCAVLTQACEATLEVVTAQLPRIGMAAGPVRGYWRETDLRPYNGNEDAVYEGPMYYATILKRFVREDDLLLPEHRAKFREKFTETEYGRYIGIESVRDTGIVDEVFCCVEPETHTFVVDQAILTGNCYGNSFTSLVVPFRRYLSCPRCYNEWPLRKVYNSPEFGFAWRDFDFHAKCPNESCGYQGAWHHIDRRSGEEADIHVKRWNPHEMEILYDQLTGDTSYIWKIPEDYRQDVRRGKLFHLERANWEVIQAVKNNKVLQFDQDVLYHMKDEALAGIRNKGWGISKVLSNFGQAWYVQVLHRYNEAIALDYVIPFRVIMPAAKGGAADPASQDPVLGANMGSFVSRVNRMLARRRRDPAAWNVVPFPLEYKALGGDANQLAPKDLLDQGIDHLLNAAGIPADMYKGTLTMSAAPPALRLFESYWAPLTHNMNGFMGWLVEAIAKALNWEPVTARLMKVTHADDMNRQAAKLQLMMGRQISQTTGLASVGMDFEDEQKKMLEEEKFVSDETQKMQEEMQDEQAMQQAVQGAAAAGQAPPGGDPNAAAGGAPPGGAPAGGAAPGGGATGGGTGPNTPVTPQELMSKAEEIAGQMQSLPDSQRQGEMIALKKTDPTLHALVKSRMEDQKQQAQQQGGQQVLAQQYGKAASAPLPVPSGLMLRRPRVRVVDV
jgi:hypothetical protein